MITEKRAKPFEPAGTSRLMNNFASKTLSTRVRIEVTRNGAVLE